MIPSSDNFGLVSHPNKILHQKCEPVFADEDSTILIEYMKKILEMTNAAGLAANQCNVLKQIFLFRRYSVSNETFRTTGEITAVMNPSILDRSEGLVYGSEGCLSFPNKRVRTRRPAEVYVEYFDFEKKRMQAHELSGVESVIFQHEFDHLNGKTMYQREYNGRI